MSSIKNENQTSAKSLPKSREASPAARRQLPGHAPDDRQSLAETLNGVEALIEDTSQPGSGQLAEQLQSIAQMTGARDAALREIARSLTANVTNPAYYFELAEEMRRQNQHTRARRLYHRALEVDPGHMPSCLAIAKSCTQTGETELAEQYLQQATEINPSDIETLLLWSFLLRGQSRPEAAAAKLRRALELAPAHPTAMLHLAEIEREQGQVQEALSLMDQALASEQFDADSRCGRGMIALQQGEWSYGWQEYEWRWRTKAKTEDMVQVNAPLWDGSLLDGKSIVIRGERDLVDNLMFASCLHDVSATAARCVVEVDHRLLDLFRRSFENIEFVPQGGLPADVVALCDFWSPLASLPRHLRASSARFPAATLPLQPNTSWRTMHANNLFDLGAGLKVGISWEGLTAQGKVENGRATRLEDWKPILNVEGIHLINLQGPESADHFHEALELHPKAELQHWDFVDPKKDLDDLASLVASLDMVIAVPNRIAHLSAALGVSTWTALSDWPSWRWGLVGERSPWYPSMKLFRAAQPGKWGDVFRPMAAELVQLARKKSNWTR